MRVLVLGATGYVGSRLVPHLVAQGHEVVAASSSRPAPARFGWGAGVEAVQCDVTDADAVARTLEGVDAVVYLVHSLDRTDFTDRDRRAAEIVARAVGTSDVRRLVYLSGLVPQVPERELSRHIASRLEVERALLASGTSAVALRAGVVIGAGSTSFEIVRQISTLFVVQPVPVWMRRQVQPVAVSDVLRAVAELLVDDTEGAVDLGGPDVIAYPDLMAACSRAGRLARLRLPAPVAPPVLVGLATALVTTAPFHTVTSLVESLHHDMVCRPGHTWAPGRRGGAARRRRGPAPGGRPRDHDARGPAALRRRLGPPCRPPGGAAGPGLDPPGRAARAPPRPRPRPRRLTASGP